MSPDPQDRPENTDTAPHQPQPRDAKPTPPARPEKIKDPVDEAIEESFPASDPPSTYTANRT